MRRASKARKGRRTGRYGELAQRRLRFCSDPRMPRYLRDGALGECSALPLRDHPVGAGRSGRPEGDTPVPPEIVYCMQFPEGPGNHLPRGGGSMSGTARNGIFVLAVVLSAVLLAAGAMADKPDPEKAAKPAAKAGGDVGTEGEIYGSMTVRAVPKA